MLSSDPGCFPGMATPESTSVPQMSRTVSTSYESILATVRVCSPITPLYTGVLHSIVGRNIKRSGVVALIG